MKFSRARFPASISIGFRWNQRRSQNKMSGEVGIWGTLILDLFLDKSNGLIRGCEPETSSLNTPMHGTYFCYICGSHMEIQILWNPSAHAGRWRPGKDVHGRNQNTRIHFHLKNVMCIEHRMIMYPYQTKIIDVMQSNIHIASFQGFFWEAFNQSIKMCPIQGRSTIIRSKIHETSTASEYFKQRIKNHVLVLQWNLNYYTLFIVRPALYHNVSP